MDQKKISKKELLEERKKRKISKQKEKRRSVLVPFFNKAACGALLMILLGILVVIDGKISRPWVKEEDTFLYVGKCVDAVKWDKRSITGQGRRASGINICFEDGREHTWNYNEFSDSEIEGMIGSKLILTMAKKRNGDEFPVAVSHENGYVYCTLEEYNMAMKEYRQFSFFAYCFCSISIYTVLVFAWYPYKWMAYKHKIK